VHRHRGHRAFETVFVGLRQILDLLAEDDRLNVYAGELEVRPPSTPTTEADKAPTGNALSRLIGATFFEHRLHVGPMGVDDLPASVEALIDLGRVPPRGGLRAVAHLRSVVVRGGSLRSKRRHGIEFRSPSRRYDAGEHHHAHHGDDDADRGQRVSWLDAEE